MGYDKLTTVLGVVLGALHQVGVVGVIPATKADWVQTGMSIALALLGFFSNKLTVAPPTP